MHRNLQDSVVWCLSNAYKSTKLYNHICLFNALKSLQDSIIIRRVSNAEKSSRLRNYMQGLQLQQGSLVIVIAGCGTLTKVPSTYVVIINGFLK